MTSAAVSTIVTYNQPVVGTYCGTVYCSQTLDYFVINCTSCTQEFNLLSCNLFIKHAKECLSSNSNFESKFTVEEEELPKQSCENTTQNEPSNLSNCEDPLMNFKQEFVIENDGTLDLADETNIEDCLSDYQDEDDIALNKLPRRKLLQGIIDEYRKHPVLWDVNLVKSTKRHIRNHHFKLIWNTINSKFNVKLTESKLRVHISRLKAGYRRALKAKQHFDRQFPEGNQKFNPRLWYFNKISFIDETSKNAEIKPVLIKNSEVSDTYLSDKKPVDEEEIPQPLNELEINAEENIFIAEKISRQESDINIDQSDDEKDKPKRKRPHSLITDRNIISCLIDEYKRHPCLWDEKLCKNCPRIDRTIALKKITRIVNATFKKNYTHTTIGYKICQLKSTYNRILRQKNGRGKRIVSANTKFYPQLWYFDKLSFIDKEKCVSLAKKEKLENAKECLEKDGTCSMSIENKNILKTELVDDLMKLAKKHEYEEPKSTMENEDGQNSSDDYIENPPDEHELNLRRKSRIKRILRSKELILDMIELYKSAPLLWDCNHPQFLLRTHRRKLTANIINTLGEKYNCYLTPEEFQTQLRYMKVCYFRALRQEIDAKKQDINDKSSLKPFYYDQMSFLKPFAERNSAPTPKLQLSVKTDSNEDFSYLTKNRDLMIQFIELYKAHTCLWDQSDKNKNNLSAQSEAYEKLKNFFANNNLEQSKEQILSAINFLHSTVVNTQKMLKLLDTTNANPSPIWFYEHLQFLGKIPSFKEKYCCHCAQSFRTIKEYEKHKIEIAGDYPYKCYLCNKGFVRRSTFYYHQATHKEPEKCNLCDFQAFDKHNFRVHMLRHKGITPFRCDQCDKGFVTSTELARHTRIHTGERPFVCYICGKSISSNSELHRHMKRHSNKRDHKCEVCGRAFYTPKMVEDHMATHSSERKYACDICGAAFKRKKTLIQHKALHSEHKKHQCTICGKMFAQRAGVYSHMKSH